MKRYSQQFPNLNTVYSGLKIATIVKKLSFIARIAAVLMALGNLCIILLGLSFSLCISIVAATGAVSLYLIYSYLEKLNSDIELKIGNMKALCNVKSDEEFESVIATSRSLSPLLYINDEMILNFYDATAIRWDTIVFAEKCNESKKNEFYGIKIKTANSEYDKVIYPSLELRDQIYDMIKERQIYFE